MADEVEKMLAEAIHQHHCLRKRLEIAERDRDEWKSRHDFLIEENVHANAHVNTLEKEAEKLAKLLEQEERDKVSVDARYVNAHVNALEKSLSVLEEKHQNLRDAAASQEKAFNDYLGKAMKRIETIEAHLHALEREEKHLDSAVKRIEALEIQLQLIARRIP